MPKVNAEKAQSSAGDLSPLRKRLLSDLNKFIANQEDLYAEQIESGDAVGAEITKMLIKYMYEGREDCYRGHELPVQKIEIK